jgi:hypothetical protein
MSIMEELVVAFKMPMAMRKTLFQIYEQFGTHP